MIGATAGATWVGIMLSNERNENNEFFKTSYGLSLMCPPISENSIQLEEGQALVHCDPGDKGKQILLSEILCTTIFIASIMVIKFGIKSNEPLLGAISVSLSLFSMVHVSLKTSGGVLNPALALVQSIFQAIVFSHVEDPLVTDIGADQGTKVSYKSMNLYLIGSLTGGILAGLFGAFNQWATDRSETIAKEA